jgi:large subunit ribosomal protein L25
MKVIDLKAEKRTVLGKKVKTLRKEGLIPAHIFGKGLKTLHVSVRDRDFIKVFDETGETGIVNIKVDSGEHPVLIRNVQEHPVTGKPLHIDFYQVNLKEKVAVNVPLEFEGEPAAVERKEGLLLMPISEIEIEALPADLPETIKVDVSKLEKIDDTIHVKDLKIDKSKIEILTDLEAIVATIGALVTKEMEEVEKEIETEQAEAAAEAEAVPEEGAEEKAEEGEEKPAEGTSTEQAPQEEPKEE